MKTHLRSRRYYICTYIPAYVHVYLHTWLCIMPWMLWSGYPRRSTSILSYFTTYIPDFTLYAHSLTHPHPHRHLHAVSGSDFEQLVIPNISTFHHSHSPPPLTTSTHNLHSQPPLITSTHHPHSPPPLTTSTHHIHSPPPLSPSTHHLHSSPPPPRPDPTLFVAWPDTLWWATSSSSRTGTTGTSS